MDRCVVLIFITISLVCITHCYRFIQGVCNEGEYECETGIHKHSQNVRNGRGCLKKEWICDGDSDCYDGSDEKYCPYDFNAAVAPINTTEKIADENSREVTQFGLMVSMKMKRLNPDVYLQAERLIYQVLFEAQMNNLTYFTQLQYCNQFFGFNNNGKSDLSVNSWPIIKSTKADISDSPENTPMN